MKRSEDSENKETVRGIHIESADIFRVVKILYNILKVNAIHYTFTQK